MRHAALNSVLSVLLLAAVSIWWKGSVAPRSAGIKSSWRRLAGKNEFTRGYTSGKRLAVVVPMHSGDAHRAVSSLSSWPEYCSDVNKKYTDLVYYYADAGPEAVPSLRAKFPNDIGKCFANTKMLVANLTPEENVYPRGPSMQFYKMFLDETVAAQFEEYDALSIVEWDVIVAHDRSFERLYEAAFSDAEPFWVKGSTLAGPNFHETATIPTMWHILGHINGNAIYNNSDPAFTEFVNYTHERWAYTYPYDVALWATIADFPYSWPLWQRYSTKFVATNLIANVGFIDVNDDTVESAIESDTLFIHGSSTGGGSKKNARHADEDARRQLLAGHKGAAADTCSPACGDASYWRILPAGTSTACDHTCSSKQSPGGKARFDSHLCGAGAPSTFGGLCRMCFEDENAAQAADAELMALAEEGAEPKHVVMCDTMRPPQAAECSDTCSKKVDTICDATCGTGRYGDYHCNWRGGGETCRFCFQDLDVARMADEVARVQGGRVVMCDTHEPPPPLVQGEGYFDVSVFDADDAPNTTVRRSRDDEQKMTLAQKREIFRAMQQKGSSKKKGKHDDSSSSSSKSSSKSSSSKSTSESSKSSSSDTSSTSESSTSSTSESGTSESSTSSSAMSSTGESSTDESSTSSSTSSKDDDDKDNDDDSTYDDDADDISTITDTESCTYDCVSSGDTTGRVCDTSCSSSDPIYGTNGCNVDDGDYGYDCRLCYNDVNDAKEDDGSIMCDTLAPPTSYSYGRRMLGVQAQGGITPATASQSISGNSIPAGYNSLSSASASWHSEGEWAYYRSSSSQSTSNSNSESDGKSLVVDDGTLDEEALAVMTEKNPSALPYVKDVKRGQLCAFVPGYLEFLPETEVSINSVVGFMPGMRIAVSTAPLDYHVFNRSVGHLPGVTITNSSDVDRSALVADKLCGEGTELIYYLSPGQTLTRTFTAKDTHSPRNELLVAYAEIARVGEENVRRAYATTAMLGFEAPSFTYGTDLFLPADTNEMLRTLMRSAVSEAELVPPQAQHDWVAHEEEMALLSQYVDMLPIKEASRDLYVPEVMAALSYSANPDGVWFINPQLWVNHHLFQDASIWAIPLVKPRFSCSMNMKLSLRGYDLSRDLRHRLASFRDGATCESGYIARDERELRPKSHVEFGEAARVEMPDISDYDVSVMYRSFHGDAALFKMSLPTVIKHFPSAREVVVVVEERDKELFESLVEPMRKDAPFPIRIVTEPTLMDGHIQQKYSKMRGDVYCDGDYILHLDSDVVLFEDITYDHIFHFGKPVLPFRRYRHETKDGAALDSCWRGGTSHAIGEDVYHEFSIFNTHVYPRAMYSGLRDFLEERHGASFEDFLASRKGQCLATSTMTKLSKEERNTFLSDFNVMGAYLWYHMPDAVHWMATDALDMRKDEWRRDIMKYAWVCQANGRVMPKDAAGRDQYIAELTAVSSIAECDAFHQRW